MDFAIISLQGMAHSCMHPFKFNEKEIVYFTVLHLRGVSLLEVEYDPPGLAHAFVCSQWPDGSS